MGNQNIPENYFGICKSFNPSVLAYKKMYTYGLSLKIWKSFL